MTTTYDGQYTTFEGSKYDRDRHPTETNKLVRKEIAAAVKSGHLPSAGVKYSVTRSDGGWDGIDVTVLVQEGDAGAWALAERGGMSTGEYVPPVWTREAKVAGHVLHEIADAYVRHTSDIMTDYWSGGSVMVYVQEKRWGPGGGLCLPRFSEREAYPRWHVSYVQGVGHWAVWQDGTRGLDYVEYLTWADAMEAANAMAADQKAVA